jgi:hypothetical protein
MEILEAMFVSIEHTQFSLFKVQKAVVMSFSEHGWGF